MLHSSELFKIRRDRDIVFEQINDDDDDTVK